MAAKKVFRVTGSYRLKHHDQTFTHDVIADSDPRARDLVLSEIGSRHGVPRRLIRLATVTALTPDQVEDPVVRARAGL